VARRAGVGKSSLYLRWPNKAQLVPELQRAIDEVRYKDSVRESRTLIRRGLRRGELPKHVSPTLIGDLIVGSNLVHVMATPVHLTDTVRRQSTEYLDTPIDTVLAGAAAVPDSR
jgi:AcrR family transcriptional regulator